MIDNPSPPSARPSRAERLERAALILILAAVATLAGKVAFFRVVDWTMANSLDAAPINTGWTNGVITELLPIGALLYIRHQKRHGRTPGLLAWSVLGGAFLFSLTAQLAQAQLSVFGWIVAAMPSIAFMVLSKMVVSMRPTQQANELPAGAGKTLTVLASVGESPMAEASATEVSPAPKVMPEPASKRKVLAETEPHRPHRVRARSLTSAAKVEKAAKELGSSAMPAEIAARAGVSESTARRYMPGSKASATESLQQFYETRCRTTMRLWVGWGGAGRFSGELHNRGGADHGRDARIGAAQGVVRLSERFHRGISRLQHESGSLHGYG